MKRCAIAGVIAAFSACGRDAPVDDHTVELARRGGLGCDRVGLLLPALHGRWEMWDRPLLSRAIQEITGREPDVFNAEQDRVLQIRQASEALDRGDCILVVAPLDSKHAKTIVEMAHGRGVPVIAYDRLIHSKWLSYYVSFDNREVGRLQGQYIVENYEPFLTGSTPPGNNLAMFHGWDGDNNALQFEKGLLDKLQPLIDDETLHVVYSGYTLFWDPPLAQAKMAELLSSEATTPRIAYAANDGLAGTLYDPEPFGILAALGDPLLRLNGKVLVTGQDAAPWGLGNIITGDQAMTVYKPLPQEVKATVDLIAAIRSGGDPSVLTGGTTTPTSDGTRIPSILLAPITIDRINLLPVAGTDVFLADSLAEACEFHVPPGAYPDFCP